MSQPVSQSCLASRWRRRRRRTIFCVCSSPLIEFRSEAISMERLIFVCSQVIIKTSSYVRDHIRHELHERVSTNSFCLSLGKRKRRSFSRTATSNAVGIQKAEGITSSDPAHVHIGPLEEEGKRIDTEGSRPRRYTACRVALGAAEEIPFSSLPLCHLLPNRCVYLFTFAFLLAHHGRVNY